MAERTIGLAVWANLGGRAFFIIWGKKVVRRRIGYVADFCPVCRELRSFKVKRVGLVGHVYYVSFGEGELAGHVRTCSVCDVDLEARPEHYLGIHPDKLDLQELAALTNPDWRKKHAARLALEQARATDPGGLSPQDRAFLLQEPFALLAPKAEERFRASHFDARTLAAIAGLFVLVALAGAIGEAVPAAKDGLIFAAVVAGIALVTWQVTQIKHRWFRAKIFPTLLLALRPLRPTPQEIERILDEHRRRGDQIGRKLDPRRLIAALAEDAAEQTALAAAAAATATFPAGSLPRTPAASPVPRPAPAPASSPAPPPSPAPAPTAAPAAAARAPVLKLKFGGIRQRFSAVDGEIMIGRAPDANIVVSEQHVSRHHASIIWDDFGNPLLVNLSQIGTSVQVDGQRAPERVETSTRLTGQGRIGLSAEFAFAEEHQITVAYEVKGGAGQR